MKTRAATEEVVLTILVALWRRKISAIGELAQTVHRPGAVIAGVLVELERRGCVLERTPTSVRLVSASLPCWRDIIERIAVLRVREVGRKAMVFDKTASTNDAAWAAAKGAKAHGTVVVADVQTAGRGRRGNTWVAKKGQSVLLSVLLKTDANVETLTLLAGLAAAEAIERVSGLDVEIKWPNDVLLTRGRGAGKVAGVLVEKRGAYVVIGIGVNVGQAADDFPASLRGQASSLYIGSGQQVDRLRVVMALLEAIERRCVEISIDMRWLAEWKSHSQMFGRTVEVRVGPEAGAVVRGQVVDVDPMQGLVVRDEQGAMHFCPAGTSTISGGTE